MHLTKVTHLPFQIGPSLTLTPESFGQKTTQMAILQLLLLISMDNKGSNNRICVHTMAYNSSLVFHSLL